MILYRLWALYTIVVSDQSNKKKNSSKHKTFKIKIKEDYVKLVPEISKSDNQSTKTSIKEDGLFSNILNQYGVILDGHHRYGANQELGIQPRTIERVWRLFWKAVCNWSQPKEKASKWVSSCRVGCKLEEVEGEQAKERKDRLIWLEL